VECDILESSTQFLENTDLNTSRSSIPELVSLRFCSMALGMRYAQATAFMRRNRIYPASGALRRWADVMNILNGRIVQKKYLRILARYVDPMASGITPVEVPKEVLEEIERGWAEVNAPGSDMLVATPPKKRGRLEAFREDLKRAVINGAVVASANRYGERDPVGAA
jgi:hypothetical protein